MLFRSIVHPKESTRVLLRQQLASTGCACDEAEGEAELLHQLDLQAPDLVICSLDLLQADDWRCLRAVRNRETPRSVEVVGAADAADAAVESQAKRLGMAELLLLPQITPKQMHDLLDRRLSQPTAADASARPAPCSSPCGAASPGWEAGLVAAFQTIGKPLTKTRDERLPNGATAVEHSWTSTDGRRSIELKTLAAGPRLGQQSLAVSGDWDANFEEVEETLSLFAEQCVPASSIDDFQTLINQMDAGADCKVEGAAASLQIGRAHV